MGQSSYEVDVFQLIDILPQLEVPYNMRNISDPILPDTWIRDDFSAGRGKAGKMGARPDNNNRLS